MKPDFAILLDYFDRHAAEVEGRSSQEPSPEVLRQLMAFARGELNDTQREQLVEQLHANPAWVGALAEEVRRLRKNNSRRPARRKP